MEAKNGILVVPKQERMTEEELARAFSVPENTPLLRAMLQVVEDHVLDSIDLLRDERILDSPGRLAARAASMDVLQALRSDLVERWMNSTRIVKMQSEARLVQHGE